MRCLCLSALCLFYLNLVKAQGSGRTFQGLPSIFNNPSTPPEVTFREITGLPNSQHGFTIQDQRFNPVPSGELTEDQKKQIKAQEDFRRAVAEANRKRIIKNKEFRASQELPFNFEETTTQSLPKLQPIHVPNIGANFFKQSNEQKRVENFNIQPVPTPKPLTINPPSTFDESRQALSQQSVPTQTVYTFRQPQPIEKPHHAFRQQQTFPKSSFGSTVPEQIQSFRPTVKQPSSNDFEIVKQQTFEPTPLPQRRPPRPRLQKPMASPPEEVVDTIDSSSEEGQTDEELARHQAENAKYSFQSSVADSINDNSHIRQETRDGLKLTGLYSYSDGFFKRTVHYVADENGYRIVKEENEPIGSGPQVNPDGQVDVSTSLGGSSLQYTLKGDRLPHRHHHSTSRVLSE